MRSGKTIDPSSPEATIYTYCEALKIGDLPTVRQCFYPGAKLEEERFTEPIWSDCTIVEVHQAKDLGRHIGEIGGKPEFVVQPGDVEVVKRVKMIHPEKGNPTTSFWYLLRNYDGEWKIISLSHIPDTNYPALD